MLRQAHQTRRRASHHTPASRPEPPSHGYPSTDSTSPTMIAPLVFQDCLTSRWHQGKDVFTTTVNASGHPTLPRTPMAIDLWFADRDVPFNARTCMGQLAVNHPSTLDQGSRTHDALELRLSSVHPPSPSNSEDISEALHRFSRRSPDPVPNLPADPIRPPPDQLARSMVKDMRVEPDPRHNSSLNVDETHHLFKLNRLDILLDHIQANMRSQDVNSEEERLEGPPIGFVRRNDSNPETDLDPALGENVRDLFQQIDELGLRDFVLSEEYDYSASKASQDFCTDLDEALGRLTVSDSAASSKNPQSACQTPPSGSRLWRALMNRGPLRFLKPSCDRKRLLESSVHEEERPTKKLRRSDPHLKWACHYHKLDPQLFRSGRYKSCAGGFSDMDKLGQHLRRCHTEENISCPRCLRRWDKDIDRQKHLEKNKCRDERKKLEKEFFVFKNSPNFNDFKSRTNANKKGTHPPEQAAWRRTWSILFDDRLEPVSPYMEATSHTSLSNQGEKGIPRPIPQIESDFGFLHNAHDRELVAGNNISSSSQAMGIFASPWPIQNTWQPQHQQSGTAPFDQLYQVHADSSYGPPESGGHVMAPDLIPSSSWRSTAMHMPDNDEVPLPDAVISEPHGSSVNSPDFGNGPWPLEPDAALLDLPDIFDDAFMNDFEMTDPSMSPGAKAVFSAEDDSIMQDATGNHAQLAGVTAPVSHSDAGPTASDFDIGMFSEYEDIFNMDLECGSL